MSLESPFSSKSTASTPENPAKMVPIDRSQFTTEKFLPNASWSIAEEDMRAKELVELDVSKLQLVDGVRADEKFLTGEELLERLKQSPDIRLDAGIMQMFIEHPELIPPQWLEDRVEAQRMPTQVYFDGSILIGRDGRRYVAGMQSHEGKWHKIVRSLENHRSGFRVSAVLRSR